mmetsp:Transcript_4358/g.15106  ORF Transcript_4358/g.15106 Transcript_4358/m.15106 type:complete len:235 (-) Transcript_4358:200-904(-)
MHPLRTERGRVGARGRRGVDAVEDVERHESRDTAVRRRHLPDPQLSSIRSADWLRKERFVRREVSLGEDAPVRSHSCLHRPSDEAVIVARFGPDLLHAAHRVREVRVPEELTCTWRTAFRVEQRLRALLAEQPFLPPPQRRRHRSDGEAPVRELDRRLEDRLEAKLPPARDGVLPRGGGARDHHCQTRALAESARALNHLESEALRRPTAALHALHALALGIVPKRKGVAAQAC